ncbi:hypothetical protein PS15p_209378 [Mucor circinelloides]
MIKKSINNHYFCRFRPFFIYIYFQFMSNIWLDPFGISLIKSNQSKNKPSPPAAPAAAEEPKVQVQYTFPCYQVQMPQQFIFYNVNCNTPFCNHVRTAYRCHCQQKKPDGKKTPANKKPDGKKKPAEKKPVDEKKKKKEEERKKKAAALAKEKENRKYVVPTFGSPRGARKGIFEP